MSTLQFPPNLFHFHFPIQKKWDPHHNQNQNQNQFQNHYSVHKPVLDHLHLIVTKRITLLGSILEKEICTQVEIQSL